MEQRQTFREVENLRFRFQMNNRLRLECLAAVSRVFRDFEEPIADDLLASIVFALPQELASANGNGHAYGTAGEQAGGPSVELKVPIPPDQPKPGVPPGGPKPGVPPDGPKPGIPPDGPKPGNPPDGPKPGNPPDGPKP